MTWENLPTDYTDAVWDGLKKYQMINNTDGTVSFKDLTEYTNKENSFFGAKDANQMNAGMNHLAAALTDYIAEYGDSSTLGLDTSMFMTSGAHIYWQKWNSGKLEIWGNATCSINAYVQTSSWGSGYSSDYFTCWGKWPVAFVNNPIVDVQMMRADNDNYIGDYMLLFKGMNSEDNSVLTHSPKFKFWRGTTKTFGHPRLAFRAVGQWK